MHLLPQFSYPFDIRSNIRINFAETHLVQPLLLLCTKNHILQVWDYEAKICLRALTIPNIEPDRVQEIKGIKFHDNQIIQSLFQESSFQLPASIMILTSDKLYSYHYLEEKSFTITNGPIGTQNRCLEFIDSQYIAVGGEGVKIINLKQDSVVKVMKGYHQRAINLMLSYKQNQVDRPRLIASSLDGTLACWNADTALETPAFKFLMQKKDHQLTTANNGNEILSIAYDSYGDQLVTVTEDHITIWSSLSGMEMNRYKSPIPIKEIVHVSHSCFPSQTYIGHGRSSEVYVLNLGAKSSKQFDYQLLLDLKNIQDIDKLIKIVSISSNRIKNGQIVLGTTHGLYMIQFEGQNSKFEFHHTFVCKLSISQSKDFVDDTGQCKKLAGQMYEKLRQYESQGGDQQNFMYLGTKGKILNCYLLEFTQECSNQNEVWTTMTRVCKQFQFQTGFGWDDSSIHISFSGRYVAVRNQNGFYVVLSINNQNLNQDMMEGQMHETLHFLSSFDLISSGMSNSLAWHTYKEELAVCVGVNEQGKIVQIEEKNETQNVGFFKKKQFVRNWFTYDSNVVGFQLLIYGFDHSKKSQIFLKQKVTTLDKPERVFCVFGYYFVISNLDFIQDAKLKGEMKALSIQTGAFYKVFDNQLVPIGVQMIAPKEIRGNINGTLMVCIYDTQIVVYQKSSSGLIPIFQSQESVQDLYFWEDLIFYITSDEIKLLTVVNNAMPINFTLAHLDPPITQQQCCEFLKVNQLESIYPQIQKRPPGQLKILMVYDYKLIVINQSQDISTIDLKHPFIEICINLVSDDFQKCILNAQKLDSKTLVLVAQMFINKNAIDQVQYLNLDLYERLNLELEHNLNETQINIDLLDQVFCTISEKEKHLTELAIKLAELKREQELEQVIQFGMQQQIFSQYSLIPLLSESQAQNYLDTQGIILNQKNINNNDQLEAMLCNLYNIFQL